VASFVFAASFFTGGGFGRIKGLVLLNPTLFDTERFGDAMSARISEPFFGTEGVKKVSPLLKSLSMLLSS
jgi:hypothetical protein